MRMDRKYTGTVTKNDGTIVPPEEWIVFRAKDLAVLPMLEAYYKACERLGADEEHLEGIKGLYGRVLDYQKTMPGCKVPDTKPGELSST